MRPVVPAGRIENNNKENAAAVSSVADAERHPGGADSGTVIRIAPEQWAIHGAGAGGWSYGVTGRRVMSAWVKSGADGKFAVAVSTSVGDRQLRYYFGGPSSGTPTYVSSTEAHFPSTLALDGCWHRLERNLAADVAAAWSGATLTGVRGMVFHAYSASSAMWVDDVRFSNAMTVERNSLLPGAVGQIACRRATDATNFGHADAFYFYDHIGNVQGVSSAGGSAAESYVQDAWGNVLSSPTTGQWATSFAGRHLTTKEQDGDVGMYYFHQRWLSHETARFYSLDPIWDDNLYVYVSNNPLYYIDVWGLTKGGRKHILPSDFPPRQPGDTCRDWGLRAQEILNKLRNRMSPEAIKAWRGYIKFLKRGGSMCLAAVCFVVEPSTAYAPGYDFSAIDRAHNDALNNYYDDLGVPRPSPLPGFGGRIGPIMPSPSSGGGSSGTNNDCCQ